jgi:hypothetical protein
VRDALREVLCKPRSLHAYAGGDITRRRRCEAMARWASMLHEIAHCGAWCGALRCALLYCAALHCETLCFTALRGAAPRRVAGPRKEHAAARLTR